MNFIHSFTQPFMLMQNPNYTDFFLFIIIINPLTARVVGAPQMILRPVSSTFPCSPLPPGTWRTPGLSILSCCLPASSSVCLVFFPLSLCLARLFWPDLLNGRHDHTTAVFTIVRRSSCGQIACWILAPRKRIRDQKKVCRRNYESQENRYRLREERLES